MHVVIQARLSSKRLPRKMLKPLLGRPLLHWVIFRVKQSVTARDIIVATSDRPEDDAIVEFSKKAGVEYFRGDLENVQSRFVGIVRKSQALAFVRISGDSPMIDSTLIDQAVTRYQNGNYDLVTNVQRRTFPKGQSVEVVRSETFLSTTSMGRSTSDLEHVTRYYYENGSKFRILNFESDVNYGQVQLSVDTFQDFMRMEQLMERCDPQTAGWVELVEIVKQLESEQT